MLTLILLQLGALVILLVLSAFFSSSETALFSLSPLQVHRLKADHPAYAERIHEFLAAPTRLLSTVLIGNTLVNVSASALGFAVAEGFFPSRGEAIAVPAMTLLLLIFGEVGPKRIAMFWPERVSLLYVPVLSFFISLFTPIHLVMTALTRRFEPLFQRRGHTLTEEEFETAVDLSGEAGVIEAEESAMVKSIIGLEDLKASDVMAPRVDIIGIDLNDPPPSCVEVAQNAGVRFLPLYCDDLDHIEAFLHVAQFLLDPDHVLARACVPPFFIPETATLDKVLAQFYEKSYRAAVVVDEYGGTAGIITRGDILEEIAGTIGDEFGKDEPLVKAIGPGRWMADGHVSIEELNEITGLHLDAEGADRLSGWITEQLERLPHPGEQVESQGCRATVRQMRRNRITLVHLEALSPS